jgi:hypothetical protein
LCRVSDHVVEEDSLPMRERVASPVDVEVRAVESAYDRAWNVGDIEALVSCFADDAIVVNPRGQPLTNLTVPHGDLAAMLTHSCVPGPDEPSHAVDTATSEATSPNC